MANRKGKIKEEFIFGAIVVAIVILAIAAEWVKANPGIGWTIIGLLVAVFVFLIYRSPRFRKLIGGGVKSAGQKLVFEGNEASPREPLPKQIRNEVMQRARGRCQNGSCNFNGNPHIHHIDMDNSNNPKTNLIALCPNCHQKAHDGVFTASQLHNWVKRDIAGMKQRRQQYG